MLANSGHLSWSLRLIRGLPRWLISTLAYLVTPVIYLAAVKEKRQLYTNIEKVFGLPRHSAFAKTFARQVLRHQAHCQLESIKAVLDQDAIHVDGLAELKEMVTAARDKKLGLVVATAHLGSWELVGHFVARAAERPFYVLAKPARWERLTKWLEAFRQQMGTRVLWTNQKTLLRSMMQVIKRNEILGFVMDQKPVGRVGPQVPFFNLKTAFVAGPGTMVSKTGCGLAMVYCLRTGPWRYRLVSRMLVVPGEGKELGVEELTATMAQDIESMVRLYPEQWAWSYRRWRHDGTEAMQ